MPLLSFLEKALYKCSKPVTSRIFDFLSLMRHLKEKEILFTMRQKLSFYLNPN